MKALVTGANGFIGSHLCELLAREGHSVRGLVRRTSDLAWLSGVPVELVCGDIREPETLAAAVAGMDWVFHTAAVLRPRRMGDFDRVNCAGTRALAQAAADARVKRFVLFSSAAAGGPAVSPERPMDERTTAAPVSLYGKAKLRAEQALLELRGRLGSVILRFPAVYGPRDRDVLKMLRSISRGFLPVLGGTFSVVHVADAARAALLAAERPVESGAVYYITDGGCHDYAEMARVAERLLGRKPLRVRVPRWLLHTAGWASENLTRHGSVFNRDKALELSQECWVCSSEKARAELGFEPAHDLERGMDETFRWYREVKWL